MIRVLKNKVRAYKKQKKLLSFYSQYINEGDLCFDIGANIGNRTKTFVKLGARVVSIEPVKETYEILKNNMGAVQGVTILQVGIGSEAGHQDIHVSNISEVSTFSQDFINAYKIQRDINIEWNETSTVEIKTLDQLITAYGIPKFCKVDVEGFELEVLKGLNQPLPLMSLEYNAKLKNVAIDYLTELTKFDNLVFNFSPYETMQFNFPNWQQPAEFLTYIKHLPEAVQTGDVYAKYVDAK